MILTPKQIEIINRMQKGEQLEVCVPSGRAANRYYIGNDSRKLQRRQVYNLVDDGILVFDGRRNYVLTQLGKELKA